MCSVHLSTKICIQIFVDFLKILSYSGILFQSVYRFLYFVKMIFCECTPQEARNEACNVFFL